MREIYLKNIVDISLDNQLLIKNIRNEPSVRKWMYTNHEITVNEHLNWISNLKKSNNHIVFAIIENNLPVGVVSINNIDLKNKKADWAYYLSENSRNGLGSFIEYNLINFIFDELKLEKLNCEVISENSSVCKLHNKFYFKEEGCKESNILRDNKRIDIILFGLKKEDWLQKKDKLFKRYSRLFNNFSIEFFYKHNIEEKKPLDLIEEARAKNNVNWMNVLRLVLELSPKNGGEIVKSIRELDKEILKLTDKLLSND